MLNGIELFLLKIFQLYFCSGMITPTQEYRVSFGDGVTTGWLGSPSEVLTTEYAYSSADTFAMVIDTRLTAQPSIIYSDTFMVVVNEPNETVESIGVTPSTSSLNAGQKVRLTATPRDANGGVVSGATVTWSSSNPNVVVTPLGSNPNKADVTSSSGGTATITATAGSASGTASVQFIAPNSCPAIDHVQVAVSNGTIEVGQTSNLQAIPKDASGNTVSHSACSFSWSSTAEVSVLQNSQYPYLATATGSSSGTATVTATVSGVTGSVLITVGALPSGDDARPYGTGNSFPPTMYQGQFYAVSVYMENTGGTTWSAPDYTLKRVSGSNFTPTSVQLNQAVAPGATKAISFNLYNEPRTGSDTTSSIRCDTQARGPSVKQMVPGSTS